MRLCIYVLSYQLSNVYHICFTSCHYINNWFYPSFLYILCDECTETGEYGSAKYQWRNWGGTFFFIYQGGGTFFLSIRVFSHETLQTTALQGKGGEHLLFRSTTSTRSQTFRYLFATLHVRRLSHIFNRNACIYKTASRWDWPPYRITTWLIDDVKLIFVCLFIDLILGFLFDMGNRWTRTRIDYHPCITSQPTNQVC